MAFGRESKIVINWLGWLSTAASVGINLHAASAVLLSRGKPLAVVRRWARRSGWLVAAFLGLAVVVVVLTVQDGASAGDPADPSMRATRLARQISEGMNCAAVFLVASALPVVVALWLGWRARRA
jgi:hypothetical protein